MMKRISVVEMALFVLLLAVGVGLRLGLRELPNFAPVAAIALFAGYYFQSWLLAASLPLVIMGISDYFIGGYDMRIMLIVHASLAMPVLARGLLRRNCPFGSGHSSSRYFAGMFGASLVASCLFFLTSNLGAWAWSNLYEHDLAGLTRCYINALPFFRSTVIGDVAFAFALFGGYAVAVSLGWTAPRRFVSPTPSNA